MASDSARRSSGLPIFVLSMGRLVDALTNGLMIGLIPYTLRAVRGLGNTDFQIGLVFSLGSLVSTAIQPLVGRRADRAGHIKIWVVAGVLLAAMATSLFVWRKDTWSFIAFRMIHGIGIGMSIPTALALVAVLAPASRMGHAVGSYVTFRMVGFLIGPPIGAWFFTSGHPDRGFFFGALVAAAAALVIQAVVPEAPRPLPRPVTAPASAARIPPVVYFLTAAQFVIGASVSMFAPLAVRFQTEMGVSPMAFSYAFSAFLLTRLVCQYPAGWLTDRFGAHRLVHLGLFGTALTLIGFPLAHAGWSLALGRALQGLTTSLITTPGLAWVARLAPQERINEALSYLTTGFGLGLATGPLVSGFLAGLGHWGLPFIAMGVISGLAGAALLRYTPAT